MADRRDSRQATKRVVVAARPGELVLAPAPDHRRPIEQEGVSLTMDLGKSVAQEYLLALACLTVSAAAVLIVGLAWVRPVEIASKEASERHRQLEATLVEATETEETTEANQEAIYKRLGREPCRLDLLSLLVRRYGPVSGQFEPDHKQEIEAYEVCCNQAKQAGLALNLVQVGAGEDFGCQLGVWLDSELVNAEKSANIRAAKLATVYGARQRWVEPYWMMTAAYGFGLWLLFQFVRSVRWAVGRII